MFIGFGELGNVGAINLSAGLGKSVALTNLDLTSNKIGDKGAKLLAESFTQSPALISVILSKSPFNISIYLEYNLIRKSGGVQIARSLLQNKSIKIMDLGIIYIKLLYYHIPRIQ